MINLLQQQEPGISSYLPIVLSRGLTGQVSKSDLREYVIVKMESKIGLLSSKAVLETSTWSLGIWSIMEDHGYILGINKVCSGQVIY